MTSATTTNSWLTHPDGPKMLRVLALSLNEPWDDSRRTYVACAVECAELATLPVWLTERIGWAKQWLAGTLPQDKAWSMSDTSANILRAAWDDPESSAWAVSAVMSLAYLDDDNSRRRVADVVRKHYPDAPAGEWMV